MKSGKEIIYTTSAKNRIDELHVRIDKEIEFYLLERKYVPGDDLIEVTASDIDEIQNRFRITPPVKNQMKTLIPMLYSVFGIIMVIIGMFYDEILYVIQGDPKRLIFIAGGLVMILISWFYLYLTRMRERKERLEERYFEEEQRRNSQYF